MFSVPWIVGVRAAARPSGRGHGPAGCCRFSVRGYRARAGGACASHPFRALPARSALGDRDEHAQQRLEAADQLRHLHVVGHVVGRVALQLRRGLLDRVDEGAGRVGGGSVEVGFVSTLSSHERVFSHGSRQPRASSPRLILMRRFGIAPLGTCLVAAVGGCGGGTPPPRIASEPLQTCGKLPPQIGTEVPLQARLVAPETAASGPKISVRIRLTSSQKVRTPAPSQVVRIVRNGDVVGKYVGAVF